MDFDEKKEISFSSFKENEIFYSFLKNLKEKNRRRYPSCSQRKRRRKAPSRRRRRSPPRTFSVRLQRAQRRISPSCPQRRRRKKLLQRGHHLLVLGQLQEKQKLSFSSLKEIFSLKNLLLIEGHGEGDLLLVDVGIAAAPACRMQP